MTREEAERRGWSFEFRKSSPIGWWIEAIHDDDVAYGMLPVEFTTKVFPTKGDALDAAIAAIAAIELYPDALRLLEECQEAMQAANKFIHWNPDPEDMFGPDADSVCRHEHVRVLEIAVKKLKNTLAKLEEFNA